MRVPARQLRDRRTDARLLDALTGSLMCGDPMLLCILPLATWSEKPCMNFPKVLGQTKGLPQLFAAEVHRPFLYHPKLCWVRCHSCSIYHMAQELHLAYGKLTLAAFGVQLVLTQLCQNQPQVLCMLLRGLEEYQYVIQIHHAELAHILAQHLLHETLERSWGIFQAKAQDLVLKEPHGGRESCLGNILLIQLHLMIRLLQIQAAKACSSLQLI